MWSIPRPQVAELNSGPDGHRMDQCPVIFQNHSGPLLMRSISRRQVAEMNSGSDGHYMSESPVIFSKSF